MSRSLENHSIKINELDRKTQIIPELDIALILFC